MGGSWFADGLRFECTACGECCRREGDVFLSRAEGRAAVQLAYGDDATVDAFLGELWVEEADGRLRIEVPRGGACPFLQSDGRCRVHAAKPLQCRTYPFWPEIVRTRRSWKVERGYCEGIGRGEPVPPDHIARLLNLSGD